MSLKGGYKIIDLKGIDVTQSTMMIEGIYESIESNYGKPLLISGIVIDGVEKDDVFVQATLNGTAYEFEIYGYTFQVQDTNAVKGEKTFIEITFPQNPTATGSRRKSLYTNEVEILNKLPKKIRLIWASQVIESTSVNLHHTNTNNYIIATFSFVVNVAGTDYAYMSGLLLTNTFAESFVIPNSYDNAENLVTQFGSQINAFIGSSGKVEVIY